MRKILLLLIIIFLYFTTFIKAYKIKSSEGKFDISIGGIVFPFSYEYSGYNVAVKYHTNNNFLIGLKFLYMPEINYANGDKKYYISGEEYVVGYKDYSYDLYALLGAEFGDINERFFVFFNLLPGLTLIDRTAILTDGYLDPFTLSEKEILKKENLTEFTVSFEFGVSCFLFDNFIFSTGFGLKMLPAESFSNLFEAQDKLLYKLSDSALLTIYFPVNIIWRF